MVRGRLEIRWEEIPCEFKSSRFRQMKRVGKASGDDESSVGSSPLTSAMKVFQMRRRDIVGGINTQLMREADVVIMDGKIIKNRFGRPGESIDDTVFVWDHERVAIPE